MIYFQTVKISQIHTLPHRKKKSANRKSKQKHILRNFFPPSVNFSPTYWKSIKNISWIYRRSIKKYNRKCVFEKKTHGIVFSSISSNLYWIEFYFDRRAPTHPKSNPSIFCLWRRTKTVFCSYFFIFFNWL